MFEIKSLDVGFNNKCMGTFSLRLPLNTQDLLYSFSAVLLVQLFPLGLCFFFYINSLSLLKFVITHYILVHLFVSRLSDPKINTAKPAILHLGTADCRKEKSLDTVVCFYQRGNSTCKNNGNENVLHSILKHQRAQTSVKADSPLSLICKTARATFTVNIIVCSHEA